MLYSDDSFVSITIKNGKISELLQLTDPTKTSDVYIAPGLIDLQINGYMGVDFSGPDLIDGVRKATKAL